MNLARASRTSVFAIVAVAWLIVFATPEYGLPWIILGGMTLGAAWISGGRWLQGRMARRVWRAVAVLVLLGLPVDVLLVSQSLLHPVLHVALVAQALMLFEGSSARLNRLLILLSLFNLLAATQLTQSLLFVPLFLAYTGLAVVALTLLHLLETATSARVVFGGTPAAVRAETARFTATRPLALVMGVAALAAVPLIVILFLTLPRSEYSLFARAPSADEQLNALQRLEQARKKTGFSNKVELGDYGRVQEDPTVVMRVKFPNGLPETLAGRALYWRAGALNHYDGYAWSTSRDRFAMYIGRQPNAPDRDAWAEVQGRGRLAPSFGDTFLLNTYFREKEAESLEALRADPDLIEQEVFLELPYADNLIGLQSVAAVDGFFPRGLSTDMNNGYRIRGRPLLAEKISYTAFSVPPTTGVDELGRVPVASYDRLWNHQYMGPFYQHYYRQLPDNHSDDVRGLVAQLTAGEDTADGIIRALLAHLGGFTYTLDTRQISLAGVPVDDFLFNSQEGYCEHFATAMVLMLREAGLPARVANGFKGGVWNEPGQFYAVRQADAHTWAEVWAPGHGWVPVDPVPGGGTGGLGSNVEPWLVPEANSYVVYAQAFWQEEVLGYNMTSQTRIVADAWDWARERPGWLWGWIVAALSAAGSALARILGVLLQWIAVLVPFAMGAVLFVVYVWRIGLPGGALPMPGRQGPRVPFYFEMLRSLRRAGLDKRDTDAPREFAAQVSAARPDLAADVAELTRLYERVRFAGRGLDRAETAHVRATLTHVRRDTRRTPAGV